MSDAGRRRVPVRSYRAVVDEVERRIYRLDRWRLPTPHGVSVRAIVYVLACLFAVGVLNRLPGFGTLLGLLPPSVAWVGLPLVAGAALASVALDGRAPHHALRSFLRYRLGWRTFAGLRRCRPVGTSVVPLGALRIAPSGDESTYRRGRIRGPATLLLRYPARVERHGKRLRVTPLDRAPGRHRTATPHPRTLARAARIEIPRGGEVIFS